jgi:hypothetical protein
MIHSESQARRLLKVMMTSFSVRDSDIISGAYVDLLKHGLQA